jgi:leucyl aminopeptidase
VEEQTITKYQKEVMNLVNAPSNKLETTHLVQWIRSKGRASGMKVTVLNKTAMLKKGLHAVLAVNRGSEVDPAFIVVEYQGNKNSDATTIGLVGKGVTFDTGGLSIKPSTNLHYMKSDMGGAATVLGTIAAIAELKWPVNVVAITPVTDNCVDAAAIKPGDVIDSYSGKTIEIIDTDAEGRLILADALAYLVRNFEIDHVIDLATLTGSAVRTFGTACAALFSNDDELSDNLITTGLATGEKLWPLPIWEEYADEMKSDIADIKNLSTHPMAGAITAAKFLQFFTLDHPSWAHLDIAGVAFGDTKFGKSKAATGWGVHLLCAFVKEYAD